MVLKKNIILFLLILIPSRNNSSEKYVIANWNAGFFSNFFCVLNNIIWCEKNKKIPVVYWGPKNNYYDASKGDNAWEYYFNPVSNLHYQVGDKTTTHYLAPDGSGINHWKISTITKSYRNEINTIINKYISLKPEIAEKIRNFYDQHMAGKKTIGIHVRGTDKYKEVRPVPLSHFVETAHRYQGDQFLIASDEQIIMNNLQKKLNKKVIFYPAHRSNNGKPIHKSVSKAILGQEVLIEAFLLSLCDSFIHSCSNVSLAILFFNPNLENICLYSPTKTLE